MITINMIIAIICSHIVMISTFFPHQILPTGSDFMAQALPEASEAEVDTKSESHLGMDFLVRSQGRAEILKKISDTLVYTISQKSIVYCCIDIPS